MEQTIVNSNGYSIFIGNDVFETIRSFLLQYEFKENRIFVLADENSRKYCLPRLMSNIQLLQKVHIIEIPKGEEEKNFDTCVKIWKELTKNQADRNSVLINLGGGVVSDIGGFVASTYKRGIRYVNIPTTLLAMVDASVGGKVGIDLENIKNQVGLFSNPQVVFIVPEFLDTLPERQLLNGYAEIIKHSLIYERQYWEDLSTKNFKDISAWKELIDWSIEIKNYFVMEDPLDTGFRKVLNYGHSIGHAVETFSLQNDSDPLQHGEAIAIGLICESYISSKINGLPKSEFDEIAHYIASNFNHYPFRSGNFDLILENLQHDKKNTRENFQFTLLTNIGNSRINQVVSSGLISESLRFYQDMKW
ncbi:MAG: 3-dehydroquinate synthase [Bacteroidales bacterium]|nr:3-dehydroquinate synthase [Bacteroidales bacterium]